MAIRVVVLKALYIAVVVALLSLQSRVTFAKCHFDGGEFSSTCHDIHLNNTKLQATCLTQDTRLIPAELGLNMQLDNKDGKLVCRICYGLWHMYSRSCNFAPSCVAPLQINGPLLTSTCYNDQQQLVTSTLNLDLCITNRNGVLHWTCEPATHIF